LKSVSEIAASIVTAKDFVSLLKQVEKAEEKMYEADTDKKEETAKQKFELLNEALESASSKTYLWKFSPGISLETPSLELEHAEKAYTLEDYRNLKKSLPEDWEPLRGYDIDCSDTLKEFTSIDPVTKNEIKSLQQFRKIVETDQTQENKIKKIDSLFNKNETTLRSFFSEKSKLTPGEQWFASQLKTRGLPIAESLYAHEFTTIEKCLEIDEDEFLKIKGAGPSRLNDLKAFKERNKKKFKKIN
jgi:hypothetical protein